MIKLLFIIACLCCTSMAQKSCSVEYEDYPPPPCNPIDENGNEVGCVGVSASTIVSTLTEDDDPNLAQLYFAIARFSWSGDCNCTITYYQQQNLGGCSVEFPFNQLLNPNGIVSDDILKQRPQSFAIYCTWLDE